MSLTKAYIIQEPGPYDRNVLGSQDEEFKYITSHHIACFTPEQWLLLLRYNDPVVAVDLDLIYNRGHMASQWFHTEMYSSDNTLWSDASSFGAIRLMKYLLKRELYDDSKGHFMHMIVPKMAIEAIQFGFIRVLRFLHAAFPACMPLSIRASKPLPGTRSREFCCEWDAPCINNHITMIDYLLSVYPRSEITPFVFHDPNGVLKVLIVRGYVYILDKVRAWLPPLTHQHAELAAKHKQSESLLLILKVLYQQMQQFPTAQAQQLSKQTIDQLASSHMIMNVTHWMTTDEMKQLALDRCFVHGDLQGYIHFSRQGFNISTKSAQEALKYPFHKQSPSLFATLSGSVLCADELVETCIDAGNSLMLQWLCDHRSEANKVFHFRNEHMLRAVHSKEPIVMEFIMVSNPETVVEKRILTNSVKWRLVEGNFITVLQRAHTRYSYTNIYDEQTLHAALTYGRVEIARDTLNVMKPEDMSWEQLMQLKNLAIRTNSRHRVIRRECIDLLDAAIRKLPMDMIPADQRGPKMMPHLIQPRASHTKDDQGGRDQVGRDQVGNEQTQSPVQQVTLPTPEERQIMVKLESEQQWDTLKRNRPDIFQPDPKRKKI